MKESLRIWIIGAPGAGKSTLSSLLKVSKASQIYELDNYKWKRNWVQEEEFIFLEKINKITQGDSWIIDGYYPELNQFLKRADLILYIRTPLVISLYRIFKRSYYRISNKVKVCNGNKESWRFFFSKKGLLFYTVEEYFKYKNLYIPNFIEQGIPLTILKGSHGKKNNYEKLKVK